MGFLLRPGHRNVTGEAGWQKVTLKDIVKDMRVDINDLGMWGKLNSSNQIKDAHSIIYSVPNPWSAAYLYNFIMLNTQISIKEKLLDLLLSLLYDYAYRNLLEIRKISLSNYFISGIDKLIPEFLKFDNDILVFKDKVTNEIYGGLSKISLVWVAQKYPYEDDKIQRIKEDKVFIKYLEELKELSKPTSKSSGFKFINSEAYDNFWGIEYFDKLFAKIRSSREKDFELSKIDEENPIPKVIKSKFDSPYFIEELDTYIFPEDDLNARKTLINDFLPPEDFYQKILEKGYGDVLPSTNIQKKWIVIDKFLESYAVQLLSLKNISSKLKINKDSTFKTISEKDAILFPVKPEVVKILKGDLSKIKFEYDGNGDSIVPRVRVLNFNLGRKVLEVQEIDRTLAIWPPYKSEVTDIYIFEYGIGLSKEPLLEFYDASGNEIRFKYNTYQNYRVYQLNERKFPKNINIKSQLDNEIINGFLVINEKMKKENKHKVKVAIDFGTTRTNIAFLEENGSNPDILTFSESLPITISQDENLLFEQSYFIPYGFNKEKPQRLSDIQELPLPWLPFLSIYRNWLDSGNIIENNEEGMLLTGGIYFNIPKSDKVEEIIRSEQVKELIMNLKWGEGGGRVAPYRKLYLKQLLTMILVELEARGYSDVEIRWTYPRAFSQAELNELENVWSSFNLDFNLS